MRRTNVTRPSLVDRTLLPRDLQEKLEAGLATNGQYHDLLPSLPTPALCDHAVVYARNCALGDVREDPQAPRGYLFYYIVPRFVARLMGQEVPAPKPVSENSLFRRLAGEDMWARIRAQVERAIGAHVRLGDMDDAEFASEARRALEAAPCRWERNDLVYDASMHHVIVPELINRLEARATMPAGAL